MEILRGEVHHHGRLGHAHGNEAGLAGDEREVADPEPGTGAVDRVVVIIAAREGDVQRAADEAENAVRLIPAR